ncbi:nucleotidyltransferase domain-containing protein [Candidatus Woesearchaeota archaeon]|nr:nucleotidyltransferase domain-containing protein [Candidatus Woesearchaeota archaeon]
METRLSILTPFFRFPNRRFLLREVARMTKVSHMTARKYLLDAVSHGLLNKSPGVPYETFQANPESPAFRNLKLFFNLERIRSCGLVRTLEKAYEYPPVVLFGSFAKARDDEQSDVDICVVTAVSKDVDLSDCEQVIGRHISIHRYSKKSWSAAIRKNPNLVNNILNGLTLSGFLEVA